MKVYAIPIVKEPGQMEELLKQFHGKLAKREKVVSMEVHDQYLFLGTDESTQMHLLQEEVMKRVKAHQEPTK